MDVSAIEEILLILTAQCNLRCRYCYQSAKREQDMDWETLRSALEFSLDSGSAPMTLVFLGGEPLLRFASIRRAVEFIGTVAPAGRQIRYEISTNGLLLNDEAAALLSDHGFSVQLSFDGVERAQDLRAPCSFASIDALLDRLRDRHPSLFEQKLRVCITLVPEGIPYLCDSVRFLTGKGVRRIGISPSLLHHPEWSEDRRAELDRQFASIFDYSLDVFRRTGETPVLFLRRQEGEDKDRRVQDAMCALADGRRLAIDVDGQVYGCAMLAESYQDFAGDLLRSALPPLRLGHLQDPGLSDRVRSFPEAVARSQLFYYKARKHSSYGRCAECEYAAACTVCPASIARDPGNADPHRVPDFMCAFTRTALKYRDRFPAMPHPLGRFGELLDRARRERLATG